MAQQSSNAKGGSNPIFNDDTKLPITDEKPDDKPEEKPVPDKDTQEKPKPDNEKETESKKPKPEMNDVTDETSDTPVADVWDTPKPEKNSNGKGNFWDDNKDLIIRVKNILDYYYPNSGISLDQLIAGGAGYINKIAGGGGGNGNVDTDTHDISVTSPIRKDSETNENQIIEIPDDELDKVIAAYNKINQACIDRLKGYTKDKTDSLKTITDIERKDNNIRTKLKNGIANLNKYVFNRCGNAIKDITDAYDVLMYINDFLTENVVYNSDSNDTENSLIGCLDPSITNRQQTIHRTACLGFSCAFVFLFCYANLKDNLPTIEVDYIRFQHYNKYESKSKEYYFIYKDENKKAVNHIYNCVKVDGKWSYIDLSMVNTDIIMVEIDYQNMKRDDRKPYYIRHRYFMTTDASGNNKRIKDSSGTDMITVVGSPSDVIVKPPGKDIGKRTLISNNEKDCYLYYDNLYNKQTASIDVMKESFISDPTIKDILSNNNISSFDFFEDIVVLDRFNKDNTSKNSIFHLAFVVRKKNYSCLNYEMERTVYNGRDYKTEKEMVKIPIIYLLLKWIAKTIGYYLVAEIVLKSEKSNDKNYNLFNGIYDYIEPFYNDSHKKIVRDGPPKSDSIRIEEIDKNEIGYYLQLISMK